MKRNPTINEPHPRPCNLTDIADRIATGHPDQWLQTLLESCIAQERTTPPESVFDEAAAALGLRDWSSFEAWLASNGALWFEDGRKPAATRAALILGQTPESTTMAASLACLERSLRCAAKRLTQWRAQRMQGAKSIELAAGAERPMRFTGICLIDSTDHEWARNIERRVQVFETMAGRLVTHINTHVGKKAENLLSLRPARAAEHHWLAGGATDPLIQRTYETVGLLVETLREGADPKAPDALRIIATWSENGRSTFGPVIYNAVKIATHTRTTGRGQTEPTQETTLTLYRLRNGRLLLEKRFETTPGAVCPTTKLSVADNPDMLITEACDHNDVIALCESAGLDICRHID